MIPVLRVSGLSVHFRTAHGVVKAVDDLAFDIRAGQTVALVGESGSGKSTAALSILRLVADPPGKIVAGPRRTRRAGLGHSLQQGRCAMSRGKSVAMIFQDPLVALNPLRSIGRQMTEVLRVHEHMSHRDALPLVVEALRLVGMPSPGKQVAAYHTTCRVACVSAP